LEKSKWVLAGFSASERVFDSLSQHQIRVEMATNMDIQRVDIKDIPVSCDVTNWIVVNHFEYGHWSQDFEVG
jgi:hypothetical protein